MSELEKFCQEHRVWSMRLKYPELLLCDECGEVLSPPKNSADYWVFLVEAIRQDRCMNRAVCRKCLEKSE
jgi:hypothetical protein